MVKGNDINIKLKFMYVSSTELIPGFGKNQSPRQLIYMKRHVDNRA